MSFLRSIQIATKIEYYFVCQRKLWLFSHHIQMEQESDTVKLGKLIHELSYNREDKEIEVESIKVDWLDLKNGILHEVKKSDSSEEGHKWQILFYLFFLKEKHKRENKTHFGKYARNENNPQNEFIITGEINYPKLKKKVTVILTEEKEKQLKEILKNIEHIISLPFPPPIDVSFSLCRKCSYLELCFA